MLITVTTLQGYCVRMRPVSKLILVLASVSFLTITLGGFHLHADAATHDDEKAPHGHVHSYAASPELDEDHIDICLFEPATEFSKGDVNALFSALTAFEPVSRTAIPSSADRREWSSQRHCRWRPELRAPPSST